MGRLYLVDGYNFIIEDPRLSGVVHDGDLAEGRRVFREEAAAFARRTGCRVRVIFDGAVDPMSHNDRWEGGGVEVSFTSRDEKADERLVAVALEMRRRGDTPTIVSNDREGIRDPLLLEGFPLVTTQAFAKMIREAAPPREKRGDALSDDEKTKLAAEFLARDAEMRRTRAEARTRPAPPAPPPVAAPAPPVPRAAERPRPAPPPPPAPRRDPAALDAKKERGKRKQERRLALIQSRRRRK